MTWLLLLGLIIVFIVAYNARRRAAKLRLRATEFQAGISKIMEIKGRPADIAIEILTRHLRTLVEKASPYIKRDDYGVLAIGSEFDSEIRYFVDRMILSDVAYLAAARDAISVDSDARARLLESSPLFERVI